jgi:hypothetical protein
MLCPGSPPQACDSLTALGAPHGLQQPLLTRGTCAFRLWAHISVPVPAALPEPVMTFRICVMYVSAAVSDHPWGE